MNPIRVRIFNSQHSAQDLESKVNEWLSINPDIEVVLITQSESGKQVPVKSSTLVYLVERPS